MTSNKICLLTVTYASRMDLLIRGPVAVALENDIPLYIVANGCSTEYVSRLKDLSLRYPKLSIMFNESNEGSAGGFCDGLKFATDHQLFDYLILLDDDNYIDISSIGKLKETELPDASFCYRDGRKYQREAKNGYSPRGFLAEDDSFMGLSLRRAIFRALTSKPGVDLTEFNFPWAPYGGLVLSRNASESGIFPNRDLFLYCDDIEYTSRLSKKFGLKMLKDIKVVDLNPSWNVEQSGSVFSRVMKEKESFRVYYSVRNQVFFDKSRKKNRLVFNFHFFLFLCLLSFALVKNYTRGELPSGRTSLLKRAISDGMNERLGKGEF